MSFEKATRVISARFRASVHVVSYDNSCMAVDVQSKEQRTILYSRGRPDNVSSVSSRPVLYTENRCGVHDSKRRSFCRYAVIIPNHIIRLVHVLHAIYKVTFCLQDVHTLLDVARTSNIRTLASEATAMQAPFWQYEY